jgi:hypothetical protein
VIGVMPIGNCSAQLKVDTAGKTGLGYHHHNIPGAGNC